ncbi:MAG TPA: hypothetical protein DEB74_09450 [Lachnospiraceae bacterium]|nr:hypothetical protein [Lachnospiraceae bacterium]
MKYGLNIHLIKQQVTEIGGFAFSRRFCKPLFSAYALAKRWGNAESNDLQATIKRHCAGVKSRTKPTNPVCKEESLLSMPLAIAWKLCFQELCRTYFATTILQERCVLRNIF